MALNAVILHGYKVNIYDSSNGITHGTEHNMQGDTVLLLHFGAAHYTSLEKVID